MSQISLSVRWGNAILPILLLAAAPAIAEHTPAGTTLTSTAQVVYTDDGPRSVSSDPVLLTVAQRPAASVKLSASSGTVRGIHAVPCTITNSSNYANGIRVSVTKSANTTAYVAEDVNGDGVWQAAENTALRMVSDLEPGGSVQGFLVVSARPGVADGATGSVTVFASPADQPETSAFAWYAATYTTPRISPRFTYQAPEPLTSSPTVRHGLALVGTEAGILRAVRVLGAEAGTLAWRYPATGGLGAPIRGRAASDDSGFYVTVDDGTLHKVSLSGAPVWQSRVAPPGVAMASMPILQDGVILLACGDGRVRRVNRASGAVLNTSLPMGSGALTTPAAPSDGDLWVGGSDGNLYDLKSDADFTVLSTHRISQSTVSATPFVDARRGLVISASDEGNVYAMKIRSNEVVWGPVALGGAVKGTPYVDADAGVAYFATEEGYLHALSVDEGTLAPGYPANLCSAGGFKGSPVVVPLGEGKTIVFIASGTGSFLGLNAAAPGCMARFDTGGSEGVGFVGEPAVSGPTPDDVVVAAASNGMLYGFAVRDAVVLP